MKRILCFALSLLMVFSTFAGMDMSAVAALSFTAPKGRTLTSVKEYNVAPGITEQHIITNNQKGDSQLKSYVCIVDTTNSTTGIMAGYKDYNTDGKWGLQTVRDQIKAAEAETGYNVVVGTNSCFCNLGTGEPYGALVMNGKVVNPALGNPRQACYFAILNDGTPVIRDSTVPLTDVKEAVASPVYLVKNSRNVISQNDSDNLLAPRGGVGITKDNKVVLYISDGRRAPISCGETMYDVAQMMVSLGCVTACYIDGGGSATYVSQVEGEADVSLKSVPSDGTERRVSSTILVYTKAKPTGVFDHATLSPYNEYYTPGASVQFSASGVDSSGAAVNLPSDGRFALEDNSFGTITKDGLFKSSGKTGKVVVNYISGDEPCGSTSIDIVIPDRLYTTVSEISLDYNEKTDFGIIAKYNHSDVNIHPGDINWKITDSNGLPFQTSVGIFDGLHFISGEGMQNVNATITATLVTNPSASVTVNAVLGAMPVVMYDFEYTTNQAEAMANDKLKYIPSYRLPNFTSGNNKAAAAEFYSQGYPLYSWTGNLTDTSALKSTVVSKDDGEPVRFGDHSLRLDYDFSSNIGSNANCYLRVTDPTYSFEGSPSAIGCWVYVPEGTGNVVLYLNCGTKDGNYAYASMTPGSVSNGVGWNGWKYVEMDLTNSGYGHNLGAINAPFGYYQGCGAFWISYQPGGQIGTSSEGTIYIDDLQLIYGTNTDDVVNPVINSVKVNEEEVVDDATDLTSNINTFSAVYADVAGKYSSGIDFSTVKMYIDGVDVTDKCFIDRGDEEIHLYDAYLSSGTHSIEIEVSDNFGNSVSEKRVFRIISNDNNLTTVDYVSVDTAPAIGSEYKTSITTDKPSDIKAIDVELKVLSQYVKFWQDFEVQLNSNYEFASPVRFDKNINTIFFKAVRKDTAVSTADNGTIADIIFRVSQDTPENLEVTFRIDKGQITYANAVSSDKLCGFSGKITTKSVSAYSLIIEPMIKGASGGYIYVVDVDGNAVESATIKTSNGDFVGITDSEGKTYTQKFVSNVQEFSVYAEKTVNGSKFVSATKTSQCYEPGGPANGAPSYVKLNATKDPQTSQNISWMSNPVLANPKAIVQYAEKTEYTQNGVSAFRTLEGTSDIIEMASSGNVATNYAVRVNSVNITGLKAGTEYVYKVGDGLFTSDVKTFKTQDADNETNFFVIGDTQAADMTNISNISAALKSSDLDFDFGIQTGDGIDNGGSYNYWTQFNQVFTNNFFSTKPLIHVLGNHEYYGDASGKSAAAYFNLPDKTPENEAPLYYSVEYDNVYVAVINYTGGTGYKKAAQWLKEDAAKSDARWKILTLHQPPYYTNPSGNSNSLQNILVPVIDEVGIDLVFSGHDHSYARTKPMTGGEVDENGTTYYICGSTGEKSYTVIPNEAFNFDMTTDEYTAVYLTVRATNDSLTVNTYDYIYHDDGNEYSTIIDEFTISVNCNGEGGHDNVHSDGQLECSVCGHKSSISGFSGFITDKKTGLLMKFDNGVATTGWTIYGDDVYYLDKNGLAVTGKYTIDGKPYIFSNDGKFKEGCFVDEEITLDDGTKQIITRYYMAYGIYATKWMVINGDYYYFSKSSDYEVRPDDGAMFRGGRFVIRTPGGTTRRAFFFDDNGKLYKGWFENEDFDGVTKTRYYWGNDYITGSTVVDGVTYNFDEQGYMITKDISSCEFVFDPYHVYTGNTVKPAVEVYDGNTLLANKTNYTVSYSNNKNFGVGTITITGAANRGYTGTKTLTFDIALNKVSNLKASSSGTALNLTWGAVKGAQGYEVYKFDYTINDWKKIDTTTDAKCSVTGLNHQEPTEYKVRAFATSDNLTTYGLFSDVLTATFKVTPLAPSTVKASSNVNFVKVLWSKVSGASMYYVYRYDSTKKEYVYVGKTTNTYYKDTKVNNGKSYSYKIKACIEYGGVVYTGASSAKVDIKFASTLAKVSGLKISSATDKSVKLTWSKVTDATGYTIYRRKTTDKTWTKVKNTTSLSFTDSGVTGGSKYKYNVVATVKINGNVFEGAPCYIYAVTKLGKVSSIKTVVGDRTVKMSWSKVPGATNYIIYRYNTAKKAWTKIKTTTSTTYTDTKLNSGTKYKYYIKASTVIDKVTYSGASVYFNATTKAAKVSKVTAKTNDSLVKLSWSKVPGATGYLIYKYDTAKKKWIKIASTTALNYTDKKLKAGTQYKYYIKAKYSVDNKQVLSDALYFNAVTAPATVTGLKVTSTKTKTATVSWTKASGATGYEVYRATTKNGKYTKVATIKNSKTVKFTDKKVSKNKTYFYKVRAYKTISSKNYFGAFSSVKSVKAK